MIQAKLEGSDGEVEDKDIPVSFFSLFFLGNNGEGYQVGLELSNLSVWGEFWLTEFAGSEVISRCSQRCM